MLLLKLSNARNLRRRRDPSLSESLSESLELSLEELSDGISSNKTPSPQNFAPS
jgi:hypothetical protein